MRGLSMPKNGLPRSPRTLGYRMPAEWEPHARTWLAWPHEARSWPGKLAAIPLVFCELLRHLCQHGRVGLLLQDDKAKAAASKLLDRSGVDLQAVDLVVQPSDGVWLRDTGPCFVRRPDGKRAAVTWQPGGDLALDARIAGKVAEVAEVPIWQPRRPGGGRFVLEGGTIEVDGQGTLLCTEEGLLATRNPGVEREAQERVLGDALGVDTVIWLDKGIPGDEGRGHVDDVCRFVAPGRVVVASEPDSQEPALRQARERLASARDSQGRKLEVIELPMPRPVVWDGQRLPASYAGFYVTTGLVLVPTFNDPADRLALGLLADCFPDRQVVGIHAVDLVLGRGTLHRLTQQEPA